MSEFTIKIVIGLIVLVFATGLVFARPITGAGKFSLKLVIINVVGWLLVLPFETRGHPPPFLIAFGIFWLINLLLLPAATIALWISFKEREERKSYIVVLGSYLVLNLVVLIVLPVTLLIQSVASS